ncbi:MAG: translation elongation factor 4, partial [Bacteroidota bacterium]
MEKIRNFCIIAHIDHGKSTLADRLLDFTGSVTEREKQDQLLDNMDLERERGITIKSHAIQMEYVYEGETYVLNLIDTPGHVDFSYEVSRSIAACEGALLVVDAAQSIQAQTISNLYLALENDLEIIPVLNKVDLPSANPEEVTDDIVDLLGCDPEEVIPASAKTGIGIEDILSAIIKRVPAPKGNPKEPLQALVFDSVYNPFRGVETYFRVVNGEIRKGQKIKFVATGKDYFADEIGTLKLNQIPKNKISTGDVGYLITGIKDAREVKVGDTITDANTPTQNAIEGFEDVKPMVFAGIYPVDTEDFEELRSSMEKLQLNDASLVFTPESSAALGFGFRCGFLGMLHMEIIQERLEREFNMTVITTVPNVSYHAYTTKDRETALIVNNPSDLPDPSTVDRVEEPYIKATIITKSDFVGNVMSLCIEKRGQIT